MSSPVTLQFFLNWARERADEMDATLASLESKASEAQAGARAKANQLIADLREKRNAFLTCVGKQAELSEAALQQAKAELQAQWSAFESQANEYFESLGKQAEQQHAAFQHLAEAQMKAWRNAADTVSEAANQFATERRSDIDATVARMKADADAAQQKLKWAAEKGPGSWSTLNAVLAETRAAFDRANQTAFNAFK
jgi:hypothetical protein